MRQPAPGEHEHFANLRADRDEWVVRRYGRTPAQLRAAAEREAAQGNMLVAYCLTEAANGTAYNAARTHHRRTRSRAWVALLLWCVLVWAAIAWVSFR